MTRPAVIGDPGWGGGAGTGWRGRSGARWQTSLIRVIERRQAWTRSAAGLRLTVLAAGLAVLFAPERPKPVLVLTLLLGLAVAVISPSRGGAALALAAGIGDWFACYGVHAAPPVSRVLWLAAALYLLHSATALAATVPVSGEVDGATVWRWWRRSLLYLAAAGVLASISYAVTTGASGTAAQLVELAGLIGTVAVAGAVVWLFSRSLR